MLFQDAVFVKDLFEKYDTVVKINLIRKKLNNIVASKRYSSFLVVFEKHKTDIKE